MIQRSELVSQWQERLTAAEDLAQSTAQFRWFHLARVRLYRFLLSCYGGGQWRTGANEAADSATNDVASECQPTQWAGKPPKSVGAIQSVLKSVHGAQVHPPAPGPLVAGLDPDTYLAVTATDARIDVEKCEQFLIDRGFCPRVVGRGRRRTVEVPYAELNAAEALVDAHREMLRLALTTRADKLRQHPVVPDETQVLMVGVMLIAPIVGVAALAMGAALLKGQLSPVGIAALCLGAFIAVAEASLLWYFVGPRWRTLVPLGRRRMIALVVFWAGVGIPAALIVATWVVENQSNPTFRSVFFSYQSLVAALVAAAAVVFTMALECVFRCQRRPATGRVPGAKSPAAEAGDAPDPCSAAAADGEPSADR
jgi:hypothetical protein